MLRKNTVIFIFLIVTSLLLSACGEKVSIPTGEVGKQLTSSGLEKETRTATVFRLPFQWFGAKPKLVRCQVFKETSSFKIDQAFLPKSNVDLDDVEVSLQYRVKAQYYNTVFGEVKPVQAKTVAGLQAESDNILVITSEQIYNTYAARKAPDAVIDALREYTVDQVLSNVSTIAEFTKARVNKLLKNTPVEITELGFPNGIGNVPEEVIIAKRQLFAIEEEKARQVKALEAELSIEEQRQRVQTKRIANDVKNAKQAKMSVRDYWFLKNMERFAEEGVPLGFVPNSFKGTSK